MELFEKIIKMAVIAGRKTKELIMRLISCLQKSRRNIVIFALISIVVLAGAILFVKYVLPTLILFLLLGWAIYYMFSGTGGGVLPNFENNAVCQTVTNFFLGVFSSSRDVLNKYCSMPCTVNEIYNPNDYIGVLYNAPTLRLQLLLTADIPPEEHNYIKSVLQEKITARLLDGNLAGYWWAVNRAENVPILKIANMEKEGMYLIISILLTNNDNSVNAARQSDKPPPPPPTSNDKDDIF